MFQPTSMRQLTSYMFGLIIILFLLESSSNICKSLGKSNKLSWSKSNILLKTLKKIDLFFIWYSENLPEMFDSRCKLFANECNQIQT